MWPWPIARNASEPDRVALGQVEGQPGQHGHRGQGGDERGHVDLGDQQAVDQPRDDAGGHTGEERDDQAGTREDLGRDHRGEAQHRPDRQVDLTEDDHERLADGQQRGDRGGHDDRHEVGGREEER